MKPKVGSSERPIFFFKTSSQTQEKKKTKFTNIEKQRGNFTIDYTDDIKRTRREYY